MRITVVGARGRARDPGIIIKGIAVLEAEHSSTIQALRADRVFGAEHLLSAAEKALRAFENGTNMSKTLGMEILLYAAAERQTSEALRKLGISGETTCFGMVILGDADPDGVLSALGLERDDSVLAPVGKDPSMFGIKQSGNTRSVADLVLEKVALSEVFR